MNVDTPEDRRFWKITIDSVKEAHRVISETSWGFVFAAALSFLLSRWVTFAWVDGLMFVAAGSLLSYKQKTWSGIVLILVGFSTAVITFYNKFTGSAGGGNIFLSVVLFFASMRGFDAIRYLNTHPEEAVGSEEKIFFQSLGRKIFPWLFWFSLIPLLGVLLLSATGFFLLQAGIDSIDASQRDSFIISASQKCFDTARADSANKARNDESLRAYCDCSMNKIADLIVKNNEEETPIKAADAQKLMEEKAAECAYNLEKSATST